MGPHVDQLLIDHGGTPVGEDFGDRLLGRPSCEWIDDYVRHFADGVVLETQPGKRELEDGLAVVTHIADVAAHGPGETPRHRQSQA
jgi:hypothetical protein